MEKKEYVVTLYMMEYEDDFRHKMVGKDFLGIVEMKEVDGWFILTDKAGSEYGCKKQDVVRYTKQIAQ